MQIFLAASFIFTKNNLSRNNLHAYLTGEWMDSQPFGGTLLTNKEELTTVISNNAEES